jgi:polyhydroxyalkanoate synthesis regulator phasin
MNEKKSVSEMLERVFLIGIGAASLTRDKVSELVDELVQRGQLTREQGEKILDQTAEKAIDEAAAMKGNVSEAFQDALRAMGIANNGQIDELERRISVLESKVYGKPSRIEEPGTGFVATPTEEEAPT